jgi:hypothetical protein
MSDLPITAVTAKLDSASLRPWVQGWQLGQQFSAQVLESLGSGRWLLQAGRHRFAAETALPLAAGNTVKLQVNATWPQPGLQLLAPVPAMGEAGAVARLLARQGDVLSPLQTLLSANLLSALGLKPEVLTAVTSPGLAALGDERGLAAALAQSGMFFEAARARGGPPAAPDLKGVLASLFLSLQARSGTGDDAPDSQLQRELQAALAALTLNQLLAYRQQQQGAYLWLFDLPYRRGERWRVLKLQLRRRAPDKNSQQDPGWEAQLALDVDGYGPVEAELTLRGGRLWVVLRVASKAAQAYIGGELARLEAALEQRGLALAALRCELGLRGLPTAAQCLGGQLHVTA